MGLEEKKLEGSLTLVCNNSFFSFIKESLNIKVGKEYTGNIFFKSVLIITNKEKYYYHIGLIASSLPWLRKGYNRDTLYKVIPDYLNSEEVDRLYAKRVEMPYFRVLTEQSIKYDFRVFEFCLLSDAEVISLGADKEDNRPCFAYANHMVDDYFDYDSIRRDNKLNTLGI